MWSRRRTKEAPLSDGERAMGADDGDMVALLGKLAVPGEPGPFFTGRVMREVEDAEERRIPWTRFEIPRMHRLRAALAVPIVAAMASLWVMVISAEHRVNQEEAAFAAPVSAVQLP